MRIRRTSRALAAALAATLVLAACGDADDDDNGAAEPAGEDADEDLDGTSVAVFGAPTSVEEAAIQNVIDETFNEDTGSTATYEGSDDFEAQIQIRAEGGNPPDVALFPQPGTLIEHAEAGYLVSLEDMGYDIDELRERFGDYLLSLGEHDGQHYGLPTNVNYKSMVWYNQQVFDDEGYEVPETWDDLVALTEQISDDGHTPWVIGTGSDAATGWPATDWMEDIMLRSAGPDAYDDWVAGDLAFDSDEVRAAAELFAEIAFEDDFIVGSTANIPDLDFRDAPDYLFEEDGAVLHRQASFVTSFFPSGTELGTDVNWFQFPEIDGQQGALIAGEMAAVYEDRPEVTAFIDSFTGYDAQCAQGQQEDPDTGDAVQRISPNLEVGEDCYIDEVMQEASQQIIGALEEGTARFDASDLMPAAVGSGSFWDGMNEWMRGSDLDQVLGEIDAAWPN